MKTFEITLADHLHHKLEAASKRAAKPIDQFVHELLARVLEEIEADSTAFEALLAEGYQVMAKENADTVDATFAAQLMAIEISGEEHYDSGSAR
jgi:predicted DNA-binding protein